MVFDPYAIGIILTNGILLVFASDVRSTNSPVLQDALSFHTVYAMKGETSPGGGYIFGTSNTIFPGMPLRNYELMLQVFREFCARPQLATR